MYTVVPKRGPVLAFNVYGMLRAKITNNWLTSKPLINLIINVNSTPTITTTNNSNILDRPSPGLTRAAIRAEKSVIGTNSFNSDKTPGH